MSVQKSRFTKGIILKPDAVALDGLNGEIKYDSADHKFKITANATARELIDNSTTQTLTNKTVVVASNTITTAASGNLTSTELNNALAELQTDIDTRATSSAFTTHTGASADVHGLTGGAVVVGTSQTQTLTNKTIDADSNTITNIENADIKSGANIAHNKMAALTSSRAMVTDGSGVASASTVTATEVGHLAGVTSAIQTQIDSKATGPASSTDNAVARFDLATGKLLQDSVVLVSDAGAVSGVTQLDVDNVRVDGNSISTTNTNGDLVIAPNGVGKVSMSKRVEFTNVVNHSIANDNVTGSSASLGSVSNGIIRLTNSGLVSLNMIPAGAEGQTFSLVNATGNTITINNDTGATAANRILTGQKAAITLKDEASLLLEYDSTESRWMVIGGTGAGGGDSSNIITNPDAEAGTAGYVTYADTADVYPVDATGGSPVITFTDSSSAPLRGVKSFLITKDAANRQGEGVSYAATIDAADQAKILTFSMDYSTSVNYTDGDVRVGLFDVTNSRIIEGSQRDLPANANGTFVTSFQTSSNSLSYRLFFHIASTNDTDYTIKMDNLFLGQKPIVKGPIVTDWVAYTPTFAGFGTVVSIGAFYRRVGDSVQVRCRATAGTVDATTFSVSIPSGLTIDPNKITNSPLSLVGNFINGGGIDDSDYRFSMATSSNNSNIVQVVRRRAGSRSELVARAGNLICATGESFSFTFEVPIVGWSSNVVLSEDTGNRVVAMRVMSNATETLAPNDSTINVSMAAVSYDTHTGYDPASGIYTIPESGYYHVSCSLITSGTNVLDARYRLRIGSSNSGNSGQLDVDYPGSAGRIIALTGSKDHYFAKGDTVRMQLEGAGNNSVNVLTLSGNSFFSIHKIQTPQSIGQSEAVQALYYGNSGQAVNNNDNIVYITKQQDTHNAYNNTTGIFTVPVSGVYDIAATATTQSVAVTTAQYFGIQIRNATTSLGFDGDWNRAYTTTTIQMSALNSVKINASRGDQIVIRYVENIGAVNNSTGNAQNWVSITKVG